ncbi:MAG: formylglycine-generating enzyme family protein [Planctomycetota bacterium]|nr:MAG: formylglycine-generating enzyme family protein [Planctomycetota bacterium]
MFCFFMRLICTSTARRYLTPRLACKLSRSPRLQGESHMRIVVVVAAMLFCAPVFAHGVKLPSVTNLIGMELIEIPAGEFRMDEGFRVVKVTLTKSFGLGKYEVTQGQWKSVMASEPWDGQKYVQADKDCPATYVNWDDATEFCEKLTDLERKSGKLQANEEYRLPTEAEWEYACRAGTKTVFSFGNDESKLGEYAWNEDNALKVNERYAHSVGLKKPNTRGLYDMHGNVFEWCSDWYGKKLPGGTDPVGPGGGSLRVARSGGWRSRPGRCRSADRDYDDPSYRGSSLGFRVARSQSVE